MLNERIYKHACVMTFSGDRSYGISKSIIISDRLMGGIASASVSWWHHREVVIFSRTRGMDRLMIEVTPVLKPQDKTGIVTKKLHVQSGEASSMCRCCMSKL